MHIIENENLRVIAKEYGAELTSIYFKKNNTEYLWQADPTFWGWHSPVLFPVVGRCLNDEVNIGGRTYAMQKHGFARKSDFKLLELGNNRMVFSLMYNESTLAIFPYKFELLIAYSIHESKLKCSYEVRNLDEQTILYSIGGHPAFSVPLSDTISYKDYYLEFPKQENFERHYIDGEGFFDERVEVVATNTNRLPLHADMFNQDAYIFKDLQSRSVALRCSKNEHELMMEFSDFNYLGLWSKPGAPYLCIEPWLGCADTAKQPINFEQKEAICSLQQGKTHLCSWTVAVF